MNAIASDPRFMTVVANSTAMVGRLRDQLADVMRLHASDSGEAKKMKQFGEIEVKSAQLTVMFADIPGSGEVLGVVSLPGTGTKVQMTAKTREALQVMLEERARMVMDFEDPRIRTDHDPRLKNSGMDLSCDAGELKF